jgi:hypothetical protein
VSAAPLAFGHKAFSARLRCGLRLGRPPVQPPARWHLRAPAEHRSADARFRVLCAIWLRIPLGQYGGPSRDSDRFRRFWPVGGFPSAEENRALSGALLAFYRSGGLDWHGTIGGFLGTHPNSVWRASLVANIATSKAVHRYANALDMWEEARTLTRAASDRQSRSVADYALAEWRELALNPGNSKVPNASG